MEFQAARLQVRRGAIALGGGAIVTVSVCWFAAWDEFKPSTSGVPMGLHGPDPDWIMTGDHDEYRPAALNAWTALTPASWSVGRRVWPEYPLTPDRIPPNEFGGIGDPGDGMFWRVRWRSGPGLSDSFNAVRRIAVNAEGVAPQSTLPPCCTQPRFERGSDHDANAPESPFPNTLAAHGVPTPVAFRASRAWDDADLPGWATLTWSLPPGVALNWLMAPEDPGLLTDQPSIGNSSGSGDFNASAVTDSEGRAENSGARGASDDTNRIRGRLRSSRKFAPTAGRCAAWSCGVGGRMSTGIAESARWTSRSLGGVTGSRRRVPTRRLSPGNSTSQPPAFPAPFSGCHFS